MNTQSNHRCRGVTLIEILVAIFVLGILLSLILAAIQHSRESARKFECSSHLRQLGLAVAQYEASYRSFPAGLSLYGSLHLSILPYIGEGAAYEQIVSNRQKGMSHDELDLPVITLFLCPSDGVPSRLFGRASTNYVGNAGTWYGRDEWNGLFHSFDTGFVSPRDVADGLSNTAALSEFLRANGDPDRLRVMWNTPQTFTDIDVFAHDCGSIPNSPGPAGWHGDKWAHGTPWSNGNIGITRYTHVLTPNKPSCYDGTNVATAASTAASQHMGGVNVVFADGHVDFISQTVSALIWRSYGSRF